MYTANKIQTFRPAHRRGYELSRRHLIFCLLITALLCLTAASNTASAAIYYVDAVNGDDSNPGSSEAPWRTLQEVFEAGKIQRRTTPTGSITNPTAPVAPGDTIRLRTGYHGSIGRYDGWYNNEGPIIIEADTGHEPQLSDIDMRDVSNWTFRGIEVRTELDWGEFSGKGIVYFIGSSSDIIIENCKISTASDATTDFWSADDWSDRTKHGIYIDAHNSIVRNNTLRNVDNGVIGGADNFLVEYNDINKFTEDGLRVKEGSDMVWQYNTVRNSLDVDGNHDDGMQVYTAGKTVSGFIIRGNEFHCYRDPAVPYSSLCQGIGVFSGDVDVQNWTVENNLLIVDHWHGITIGGATNSKIMNNTVVHPPDGTHGPGINVGDAVNTLIKNNIVWGTISRTGFIKENNLENTANNYYDVFNDYDNYDFTLKPGSPAIDAGSPDLAPNIDILGTSRPQGAGYDIGAYEYISGPPDTTPPSTPQNLSATAISEHQIDLTWDASTDPESGIRRYNIYRDDLFVATSDSNSYSDTGLNGGTTYSYEVSAVNGASLESGRSNTAEATTLSDTTAPSIVSVGASETSLEIVFSEILDPCSAENISNYAIIDDGNNGISISSAFLHSGDTRITLSTAAHTESTTYTLTVTDVEDLAGNPMTGTTTYEYNGGLVAHWKFNDGDGVSALDSSGNGNTGTLVNNPTWTGQGELGFDGIDDAVEIGTADLNISSGTITLWAKAESFSGSHHFLFGHMTQPWSNRIQLYTDDVEGYLDLGLGDSHVRHANIENLDTQTWYHIALTWDGTNYVVYVDGDPKANGTYTGLSTLETYADIGNNGYSSDRSEAFNGTIDEVRVYNRALNATEILQLYNAGVISDTNAPIISNVLTPNISSSGATITWNTDENSTSQVEYGLDTSYGSATDLDTNLVTSHSVLLTGLASETLYHYHVRSKDASGNESISQDNTFPTSGVSTYSITANTIGDGSIIPSGTTQIASGGSQTYTITPNAGYHISDVLVDGSSVGAVTSYPFTNITADHTIAAIFAIDTYTLNVTAVNGSVTKSPDKASYNYGETVTLETAADTGYSFANWSGAVTGSTNPATVVMNADKSVTANFAINTYTLSMTAVNGSVTKTPDKASYNHGETVSLQASADTGYNFVNWTGDVTGSSNPATVVMDADKSVTANFAINTYTLNITALNGSVTKTPDKASYNYGEEVILQATADTGYSFVNWSGDLTGSSNPATIVMDAEKSATANFVINTYTLNLTAVDGSVTKTPDQASYNYGEEVTLQAVPDTGYSFVNWSGDLTGSSNPTTIVMNADKSVTANFAINEIDETAPIVTNLSPQADSIQAPLNTLVILDIADSGDGVDANSVTINVNDNIVYSGNTAKHSSTHGKCHRIGTKAKYRFIYQSNEMFDFDQPINVTAKATDLAGNVMDEYSYSFKTEMRSFGRNKRVDPRDVKKGRPVTVCDNSGNIWAAWHAGVTGSRDIYIGKLEDGAVNFNSSVQLTSDAAECNPVTAVGSDGKLYVAWQDNRRGNWDIYISTSNDWSAEIRVTDSNDNQINPAIVVDSSLPNNVYIVWEDDRNGNQDIYIATSSDGFVTTTVSQITSNGSDQVEPAIAVDSDNTVYVVWTDTRNGGKNDIYGAASNSGSWTNVPVVTEEDGQSSPAIAAEAVGSILHLVWVDDRIVDANDDIFYAKTDGGLPGSPLTGSSIIDDDTGADQISPVIITTGTGDDLKVFACWRDERNADADLYAVEIGSGAGTNVFVGDDGTNSDQSEPAIGIDKDGHPYLVWTNERTDICYAGSTFIGSELASTNVSITSKTTVGTVPGSITNIDDVSAEVPQGAYLCDVKVTISRIRNPHKPPSNNRTFLYEFGPSGTTFSEPVTITIPYNATTLVSSPSAYWYNPLTGLYSQEGITDVEVIQISSGLYALRFKTTHFSIFGGGGPFGGIFGGGGGGGGCSMSPNSQDSIAELLLPYIGLVVAMVVLKLRDRRKRKAHNITKSEC